MKYVANWIYGNYTIDDDSDYGITLATILFTSDAKTRLLESDMELLADIFAERITSLIKERGEEGNLNEKLS